MSEELRRRMVEDQLVRHGISDRRVLDAMGRVPREAFVPEALASSAYMDGPLSIGGGQTISQPYIVALMAELAQVQPGDRVLEVGAGSGYAAAILGQLADRVFAIERHASLAGTAAGRMQRLGYANVTIRTGDGTLGLPEEAPFDAILVAAGGKVPEALRRQLTIGGRLVIPASTPFSHQRLKRFTRTGPESWDKTVGPAVTFVPLVSRPD